MLPIFFIIASAALFSIQFPILKLALNGVSASQAALMEAVFTLILCAISARVRRIPLSVPAKWPMFIAGLLNALGLICLFESLALVHPATVGLLAQLYFVYTLLIGLAYFGDQLRPKELAAGIGTIAGIFLFSYRDFDTRHLVGIALAALHPLAFALQHALAKKSLPQVSPNTMLFQIKCWCALSLAVYNIFRGGTAMAFHLESAGLVLISTFLATFAGLLLFYEGLRRTKFSVANIAKTSETLFIVLVSSLFFPVPLTAINFVGLALLCSSLVLLAYYQSRSSRYPSKGSGLAF